MASEREEIVRVLRVHLDRQEWDEAIVGLNKLIKLSPQNLKLHRRLAHLYRKVGNTEKALDRFQHCAQGFYERKEYKEALAAATSILKLQPGSQFALEMAHNAKGKLDLVRKEIAGLLKEGSLASLPTEVLDELASCLQVSVHPRGATIVKEGDPGFHFFLIRCGEVQVYLTNREGYRFPVAVFREGDLFGEISVLTGSPRTATVVATEQSEFWVLGKQDFDRLVTKYPRFKEVIHQYCRERINDSLRLMRTHGIERRFFPRIPAELEAQVSLLDKKDNLLAMGAVSGSLQDLSLSGLRLRVPLSHLQRWTQLRQVRRARVVFALAPSVPMSLSCYVKRVRQKKQGSEAYAELSLSFGELDQADKEQINTFITRQLLSKALLD